MKRIALILVLLAGCLIPAFGQKGREPGCPSCSWVYDGLEVMPAPPPGCGTCYQKRYHCAVGGVSWTKILAPVDCTIICWPATASCF
jgi:hypothetical protein